MAIAEFEIKRHDLQPYYPFKVTDAAGDDVDITGATIYCTMKLAGSTTTPKINRQTAGISITSASAGEAEYQWQGTDTGVSGEYLIEFEITPLSGGKYTVPSRLNKNEKAYVRVWDDLDNT